MQSVRSSRITYVSRRPRPLRPDLRKDMEPETKEEKIRDMLNRQSLVIGAAPISNSHLEEVEKKMIARGVLDPKPAEIREEAKDDKICDQKLGVQASEDHRRGMGFHQVRRNIPDVL